MKTHHLSRRVAFVCLFLGLWALAGCGGANSDEVQVSETRTDGEDLSADDEQAVDFIRAQLAEHWIKGPDGWTTELQQYNVLGELMPDRTPIVLYRQYRELSFSLTPDSLTEAQKLNGADYRGVAAFKDSPVRYFQTEATYEGPQGWGNWRDGGTFGATLGVERRNGQWLVSDSDLFAGIKPNPADVPTGN
jgi:hypothetical protein